jgi:hypothetical protein
MPIVIEAVSLSDYCNYIETLLTEVREEE